MSAPVFIDEATVRQLLPMPACIDLMAEVQIALSRGEIELPLRSALPLANGSDHLAIMPGELREPPVFGAKLLSLFPANPVRGRPAIQGEIVLFDGAIGAPLAVVDAASVTAIRTAAASGAATRALARPDARVLALLGCGVQARTHLEAMLAVRAIDDVRVWGRSRQKAAAFAQREARRLGVRVVAVDAAQRAVDGADLVCTVTGAEQPIVEGRWLEPGTHLNLVGSHTPRTREADGEVLARARIFTEVTEFALAEAGDILLAIEEGHISGEDIAGEIGEVLDGRVAARADEDDITLYKSLGNTAQDLAAAHYVYSRTGE